MTDNASNMDTAKNDVDHDQSTNDGYFEQPFFDMNDLTEEDPLPDSMTLELANSQMVLYCAHGNPTPDLCGICMLRNRSNMLWYRWQALKIQDFPPVSYEMVVEARKHYFQARAAEQNTLEEMNFEEQAQRETSPANRTSSLGGIPRVRFADDVEDTPKRHRGDFRPGNKNYMPGKYAGDWLDTSGMFLSYEEFYGELTASAVAELEDDGDSASSNTSDNEKSFFESFFDDDESPVSRHHSETLAAIGRIADQMDVSNIQESLAADSSERQ